MVATDNSGRKRAWKIQSAGEMRRPLEVDERFIELFMK